MFKFSTVLLAGLAALGLCYAQDTGSIRGNITDPSGAAVPEAAVTAKNVQTGLTQTVKTSGDGVYTMLYLPVGNYSLSVEKQGFRKSEVNNFRVDVNSVVPVNVQLTVGAMEQTVEVTGAAPLLEVTGSNLGTTLPTKAIMDLPLSIGGGLRSNMSFLVLTPGVIGPGGNPRIGGGMQAGQSEQLDGSESQSERRNDAAMNGVSVEGVEEFKVQSSGYSAEFGRTSDGVINWVTKSGTNQLHGDWFTFGINEFFNARGYTFTPTVRTANRQWNNGGTIGGPLYIPHVYDGRNKAFFFFTYERYDQRIGTPGTLTTVVVDQWRQGNMSSLVNSSGVMIPIYNPYDATGGIIGNANTRAPFPGNIIPASMIAPLAKTLMSVLPEPQYPGITNNILSAHGSTGKSQVPSIKGDYIFSAKNRINFFYSNYNSPAPLYQDLVPGVPPSGGWGTTNMISYYRVNEDFIVSPTMMNHFSIGLNRRHVLENPYSVSSKEQTDAFAQATYAPGNPTPWTSGRMTNYGGTETTWGTFVGTDSRQRSVDAKEQLAWIKGKHSIKFGGEYLRWIYRRLDYNDAYGTINFSGSGTGNPSVNGTTGDAWASMLLGLASGGTFRYPDDTAFHAPYAAWYAQDDIKLSPKLTLNIGLRYELPYPKEERHHHNSNFCPTCPNPDAGGLLGTMQYVGTNGLGNTVGQLRENAFGPRFGIAYQLNSKTVIRAGGSIYYMPPREDGNADNGTQGYAGTYSPPSNYISTGISMLASQGFLPFAAPVAANLPVVKDANAIQLFGTPFWYFPPAGRTPYFTDLNFTIERRLSESSRLRVSYHNTGGVRLLTDWQNGADNALDPKYIAMYGNLLNTSLSSLLSTPADVTILNNNGFKLPYTSCTAPSCPYPSYPTNLTLSQALRPFPQYSGIDTHAGASNDGHLTFNALENSFEHRFSHGLYALITYTWAKTIDNTDGEDSDDSDTAAVQNPSNKRLDKAVSDQDTRHNLRFAYVFELPVGRGKRYLNNMSKLGNGILGNWRISGIQTYVSGTPLSISCGQNLYGASGSTRCSFVQGAGTAIPLINPAWNSNPANAYGPGLSGNPTPYLNPAAFVQPANGAFGNAPRYIDQLRGQWTQDEDLAVLKNFHVTERKYFEFRATATNFENRHVMSKSPTTSFSSSNFGYITSAQASSPRSVQLGLKFIF